LALEDTEFVEMTQNITTITPFKVYQGHQFRYQSTDVTSCQLSVFQSL